MGRYAVVGASHGTGLAIVQRLAAAGHQVRAISRNPGAGAGLVEAVSADVTQPASIAEALKGNFDAVFYTVDMHGVLKPRAEIRKVTYQGCANTIAAADQAPVKPKFVLLSVIGSDKPSSVWWLLNSLKAGLKTNIGDRERSLRESGLPFVILRAPKLNDEPGGERLAATDPVHALDFSLGISRSDLARAMIQAADQAPPCSIWDVFASSSDPTPEWLR